MLRHLPPARDRSVFDRNMAMMRALEAGEPVTRVAKRYGVTRQWVHGLRRRHAEEGEPGPLPRSRRPRSVHNRTSGEARARLTVDDLLEKFHEASGRKLDNDRMLLV